MTPTVLTRKAMYDLVWSKPMSKVAQDFGISDVALKKICEKHRVPTPPRGYWAKKEFGKPVKQVRFVETADPLDKKITIQGSNQADLPEPVREILQRSRVARTARSPVSVSDHQSSPIPLDLVHPAIAETAKKLRTQKPNKDGVVSAASGGCCGVDISAVHVERCIAVLDALARALAVQNAELVPTGNGMAVTAGGVKVGFRLLEYVQREKHTPTLEELEAEERRRKRLGITWESPYDRAYPEWDFIRTGQLIIEIENQYVQGLRRTWKDGKQQRLDKLIDDVVAGIVAYTVAVKLKKEEQERWQRNYERSVRINARSQKRAEREQTRRKILDELVSISTEAAKLRTWLEEVRRWPERPNADEFTRFVDWARERLSKLEHAVNPDGIA